jgi:hypothetical protein
MPQALVALVLPVMPNGTARWLFGRPMRRRNADDRHT